MLCHVLWYMSTTRYQFRQNRHFTMTECFMLQKLVLTHTNVYLQNDSRKKYLSVAENSRMEKIKPSACQLLLLQKFSSLQISLQFLVQTIRQTTKGSYCPFFLTEAQNTVCRFNSYSLSIWNEIRRRPDLHTVVPTCKILCNVHVTSASDQSSSSWTWQQCHTVAI